MYLANKETMLNPESFSNITNMINKIADMNLEWVFPFYLT